MLPASTALVLALTLLLLSDGCHKLFPFETRAADATHDLDATNGLDGPLGDGRPARDGTQPAVPTLVRTGEETVTGSATRAIPGLLPDKSFVACSFRTSKSEPYHVPTCQLEAGGVVIATGNPAAAATVRWHVVQLDQARSQRRHTRLEAAQTTATEAIDSVDLGRTFVLVTSRMDSSVRIEDEKRVVGARLANETSLVLTRGEAGLPVDIEWQVVELRDANVQAETSVITGGNSSVSPPIAKIDPLRSMLVFNTEVSAEANGVEKDYVVRGRIDSETQLAFERTAATCTIKVNWFVVELLDGSRAEHDYDAVGDTLSYTDTLTSQVAVERALPLHSIYLLGGDESRLDSSSFTSELETSTTLVFMRDDMETNDDPQLAWSVVEFAP